MVIAGSSGSGPGANLMVETTPMITNETMVPATTTCKSMTEVMAFIREWRLADLLLIAGYKVRAHLPLAVFHEAALFIDGAKLRAGGFAVEA